LCTCACACPVASPFQLVLHEGGHGADLDGVGVVGRVLEEAVVGVEELLGQQEEELPGGPAVVQPDWWRVRKVYVAATLFHTVYDPDSQYLNENRKIEKEKS